MRTFLSRCWFWCWTVFAVVVVTAALLISVARLLLPMVADHRDEIVARVSDYIGQPLAVRSLEAQWSGLYPELKLADVRLLDQDGKTTLLQFDELRIAVNPLKVLLARNLVPARLAVVGASLTVERDVQGAISVAGMPGANGGMSKSGLLAVWLAAESELSLIGSEIHWYDRRNDDVHLHFSAVELTLVNEGDRHRVAGAATLPTSYGRRLVFVADVTGDVTVPGAWTGRFFAQGDDLRLRAWSGRHTALGVEVLDGVADCRLWGNWSDGGLSGLEGTVAVRSLRIGSQMPPTAESVAAVEQGIDTLDAWLRWRRERNGWDVEVKGLQVQRGTRAWPESELSFSSRRDAEGVYTLEGRFGYLHLQDAADFALVSSVSGASVRERLLALQPAGELTDVSLRYQGTPSEPRAYALRARLRNLATRPWLRLPGVSGLSGQVELDERGGELGITGINAGLDLRPLFRDPIELQALDGRLEWTRGEQVWTLHARDLRAENAHLKAQGTLDAEWPRAGGAPTLDLRVQFHDGVGAATPRYLPVGIMPPATVAWLDRALVHADIGRGELLFQGRTSDFPFDQGNGRFTIRFPVSNAILDYGPGWPRIEEIEADIRFENRSMRIEAGAGRIFNAEILRADVGIDDLQRAVLSVQGTTRSEASDLLRFLRESPLQQRSGDAIAGIEATGPTSMDLNFTLPLAKALTDQPVTVQGEVVMTDSKVDLSQWNLALESVQGTLGFGDQGLRAEALRARMLGNDVTLAIDTPSPATGTVIELRGRADTTALAGLAPSDLWKKVSGATDYRLRVQIPVAGTAGRAAQTRLKVESDLRGVAIEAPAPFGKSANQARALLIDGAIARAGDAPLDIRYGDEVSAALQMRNDAKGTRLHKGELRLGAGAATLPDAPGLRIAVRLDRFSVSELRAALGVTDAAIPEFVSALDLDIGDLEFLDRRFHQAQVKATRVGDGWDAQVRSDELAGLVHAPEGGGKPLAMTLEYLRVPKSDDDEPSTADPRRVPPLRVSAQAFEFHGTDYGALALDTTPTPEGMHVDAMKLESPDVRITATGDWRTTGQDQNSEFDIQVFGHKLSQVLAKFGYAGSVKEAETNVGINARWPGAPADFSLHELDGRIHVKIGAGRFKDIEPGAGRIFGLFSLQALPRRLSLDFSDFFKKGFSFDLIEGDFTLSDGDAFTTNLYMVGPAARIDVSGRTGLMTRDYDQLVTVTPSVSSTIPLAGALVHPGVGAALFLTQKLFQSRIDEIVRYQYTLQGSWDDPVVERLERPGGTPGS